MTEETKSCCEESTTALAEPLTSRVAPGLIVWIPTFDAVVIIIAGTAFESVVRPVDHNLAETPVSNRISPVVCIRIRSEADDPLKKRSSCTPLPVLISAMTVLL